MNNKTLYLRAHRTKEGNFSKLYLYKSDAYIADVSDNPRLWEYFNRVKNTQLRIVNDLQRSNSAGLEKAVKNLNSSVVRIEDLPSLNGGVDMVVAYICKVYASRMNSVYIPTPAQKLAEKSSSVTDDNEKKLSELLSSTRAVKDELASMEVSPNNRERARRLMHTVDSIMGRLIRIKNSHKNSKLNHEIKERLRKGKPSQNDLRMIEKMNRETREEIMEEFFAPKPISFEDLMSGKVTMRDINRREEYERDRKLKDMLHK